LPTVPAVREDPWSISKSANITMTRPGEQVVFTILVTNTGINTNANAELVDVLPPGLVPASATCGIVLGGSDCTMPTISGQTVRTYLTLTMGSSAGLVITAMVGAVRTGDQLVNQAIITPPGLPSNLVTVTILGPPTAIQLAEFEARAVSGAKCGNPSGADCVAVTWATMQELNTLGFNLLRAESSDGTPSRASATAMNEMLILGTELSGASYGYVDRYTEGDVTYAYWLQEVDFNGQVTEYGPVTLRVDSAIR